MTKYLECTQYCNIFSVHYTYILKKQFYDQNFITNSNVRNLFPQSDWWHSTTFLNFGYSVKKYNLLFKYVSAAELNLCVLLESIKFLKESENVHEFFDSSMVDFNYDITFHSNHFSWKNICISSWLLQT